MVSHHTNTQAVSLERAEVPHLSDHNITEQTTQTSGAFTESKTSSSLIRRTSCSGRFGERKDLQMNTFAF